MRSRAASSSSKCESADEAVRQELLVKQAEIAIGAVYLISGLKSRPELHDRIGQCTVIHKNGRVGIDFNFEVEQGFDTVAVKPENLEVILADGSEMSSSQRARAEARLRRDQHPYMTEEDIYILTSFPDTGVSHRLNLLC